MDNPAIPKSITEFAKGDHRRTQLMLRSLKILARQTKNPALAEMARDVLAGRADLRAIAKVEAYGEALSEGFTTAWKSFESLSQQQQESAIARARAALEKTQ